MLHVVQLEDDVIERIHVQPRKRGKAVVERSLDADGHVANAFDYIGGDDFVGEDEADYIREHKMCE